MYSANILQNYKDLYEKVASLHKVANTGAAAVPAGTPMGAGTGALIGGGLTALGTVGTAWLMRRAAMARQAEELKKQRNLAFGGGIAAGLALPNAVRGVGNMVAPQQQPMYPRY